MKLYWWDANENTFSESFSAKNMVMLLLISTIYIREFICLFEQMFLFVASVKCLHGISYSQVNSSIVMPIHWLKAKWQNMVRNLL